jgi:hypothetical protein
VPHPCECASRYDQPGSPARLAVTDSGLLLCRWCSRTLHPVPYSGLLKEAAPALIWIAKRHRERS